MAFRKCYSTFALLKNELKIKQAYDKDHTLPTNLLYVLSACFLQVLNLEKNLDRQPVSSNKLYSYQHFSRHASFRVKNDVTLKL